MRVLYFKLVWHRLLGLVFRPIRSAMISRCDDVVLVVLLLLVFSDIFAVSV